MRRRQQRRQKDDGPLPVSLDDPRFEQATKSTCMSEAARKKRASRSFARPPAPPFSARDSLFLLGKPTCRVDATFRDLLKVCHHALPCCYALCAVGRWHTGRDVLYSDALGLVPVCPRLLPRIMQTHRSGVCVLVDVSPGAVAGQAAGSDLDGLTVSNRQRRCGVGADGGAAPARGGALWGHA